MAVKIPKAVRNVGEMNHRHGDIGLIAIEKPEAIEKAERLTHLTLASGASTGHSHRIIGADSTFAPGVNGYLFARDEKPAKAVLYSLAGTLLLDVQKKAALVHNEHGTIFLGRGWYEVRGQREWSPEGDQRVFD